MGRQYVDISGALFRQVFKYDKVIDQYRIERPHLDVLVGILRLELERMKRKEKPHG